MSQLAIPVSHQILWATADVKLWVDIILWLRNGAGNYVDHSFRIDSGTEITTFPAYEARQLGLVVPVNPAPAHHEQTGLEVRSGMLSFRIDGMDQTLYAVPCLFLGDPDVPPSPNVPAGAFPRKLLQPLALLDKLRFTMEKDPASAANYGELVVEKK
jgi:hypothetical protein